LPTFLKIKKRLENKKKRYKTQKKTFFTSMKKTTKNDQTAAINHRVVHSPSFQVAAADGTVR